MFSHGPERSPVLDADYSDPKVGIGAVEPSRAHTAALDEWRHARFLLKRLAGGENNQEEEFDKTPQGAARMATGAGPTCAAMKTEDPPLLV